MINLANQSPDERRRRLRLGLAMPTSDAIDRSWIVALLAACAVAALIILLGGRT